MDEDVLPPPATNWLDRVCKDQRVWCTKQGHPAVVVMAYCEGQIALHPIVDGVWQPVQVWYTDTHGRGLDGSQILQPYLDIRQVLSDNAINAILAEIEPSPGGITSGNLGPLPNSGWSWSHVGVQAEIEPIPGGITSRNLAEAMRAVGDRIVEVSIIDEITDETPAVPPPPTNLREHPRLLEM